MTAKIKLNAASGGGSFSLQAPSSSSNNRVFTIPDEADATLLTSNTSTGKILQVVSTTKQDTFSIQGVNSGGSYAAITGLSAAITPSSLSNKILITCSLTVAHTVARYQANFRLYKAGSHLTGASGTATSNREAVWMNFKQNDVVSDREIIFNQYLDTAGGTSSITYQIYVKVEDGSGSPNKYLHLNTNGDDNDNWYNGRASSTITLMEIAA